jgi:hypothetical protein
MTGIPSTIFRSSSALSSRNEQIGLARESARHNGYIVSIFNARRRRLLSGDNLRFGSHETGEVCRHSCRESQLRLQNPFELADNRVTGQQRVVMQHGFEELGAETSRSDSTCEDVRIEKYPHETSRKTSSSVR